MTSSVFASAGDLAVVAAAARRVDCGHSGAERRSARVPGLSAGGSGSDELHDGARASPASVSVWRSPPPRAGVTFVHEAPTFDAQLEHIMPQVASMGASVAVADFDRDGWQDFYVTNSARAASTVCTATRATAPSRTSPRRSDWPT